MPDPKAIENLKFSEALPRALAEQVYLARFSDEEAIHERPGKPLASGIRRLRDFCAIILPAESSLSSAVDPSSVVATESDRVNPTGTSDFLPTPAGRRWP